MNKDLWCEVDVCIVTISYLWLRHVNHDYHFYVKYVQLRS
jgi:hypothetical protein